MTTLADATLDARHQGASCDSSPLPPAARCAEVLDGLVGVGSPVRFACLGTADGRLVAAPGATAAGQRNAAMSSSLIALCESFAREALKSACTHSMVVTEHGTIVSVRVPDSRRAHVLAVGADASCTAALVLRTALDTATAVARILDPAHAAS